MLNEVMIKNSNGAFLHLPLQDISGGLVVRSIEGLDPVKADVSTTKFAQMDGDVIHSSRRDKRNIILRLGIEPDYMNLTMREVRNEVYGFMMPKSKITLYFYQDDDPDPVWINGTIETMDSSYFSKSPEIVVSVLAPDPNFSANTDTVVSLSTTSGATESLLPYTGTTDTGYLLTMNVNRTLSAFTVNFRTPDNVIQVMDVAASLVAGDIVYIKTIPGAKASTLTRAGASSSLLYAISPTAAWSQLRPGTNKIRVYAAGSAIPYTLTYTKKFGAL